MKSIITRIPLKAAVTSLGLAIALPSIAQVQLSDNFESYADQAGFSAIWTANTTAMTFVNTNRSMPAGAKAVYQGDTAQRSYFGLPATVSTTNLYYSVYFYDGSANNSSRCFTTLESRVGDVIGGGLNQLIMIGRYNSITGNKYYGRIVNGGPILADGATAADANSYFQLGGAANRTVGWHKAEIVGGPDANVLGRYKIRFFIDGVLGGSGSVNTERQFKFVQLGSALTSTSSGGTWFDSPILEALQMIPQITLQPTNQNITAPAPVSMYVTAITGSTTNVNASNALKYQWRRAGTNIVGATTNSYTIPVSNPNDSDTYDCVVSDIYGSQFTVSDSTFVSVQADSPIVTAQLTNQMVNIGSSAEFYVQAQGSGTLTYIWKHYGTNIPGATAQTGGSATYTIPSVTLADAGPYTVTITNDLGGTPTTSGAGVLTVNNFPTLNVTTVTNAVGKPLDYVLSVTEDYSPQAVAFQAFETNALGRHTMFAYPSGSGTTDLYVDNPGISAVTNNFPVGHGGGNNVLEVAWNWTNAAPPAGWVRLTTASSAGAQDAINPIVYFTGPLRFDLWCSKDLQIAIGVRESGATGPIGTDAGAGSAPIEFVGVTAGGSAPAPTTTVGASNWTTVEFTMPDGGVAQALGTGGNGVLDLSTGKGTLEHLALLPGDGNPGDYLMYVDNFVSVPTNALTFELVSGPIGATVDKYTGRVQWTPDTLGAANFTVKVTDAWGLDNSATFAVQAVDAAVPGLITITPGVNSVTLSWTNSFQLQSNSISIGDPTKWYDVPGVTTAPHVSPLGANPVFFRLRK